MIDTQTTYLGRYCENMDVETIDWIDNGDGTYYGGSSNEYQDSRDTEELKAFEDDYKTHMSQAELAIYNNMNRFRQLDYLINAHAAINMAISRFPNMNQTDTKADAFRHAYFSILNVMSLGMSLATSFGNAHEEVVNQSALAKSMDLFNNNAGRNAYVFLRPESPFWTIYSDLIYDMVNNGSLRYINNGQLIPSNQ